MKGERCFRTRAVGSCFAIADLRLQISEFGRAGPCFADPDSRFQISQFAHGGPCFAIADLRLQISDLRVQRPCFAIADLRLQISEFGRAGAMLRDCRFEIADFRVRACRGHASRLQI